MKEAEKKASKALLEAVKKVPKGEEKTVIAYIQGMAAMAQYNEQKG